MGFLTGEASAIDGLMCLRNWKVAHANIPASGYCSSSSGMPVELPGNDDWQGVAQAYGGNPARLPGGLFTFAGKARNGNGCTGPAIGEKLEVIWDVEGGDLLYHVNYFAGTGALQIGGAVTAAQVGTPSPVSCKGLYALLGETQYPIRKAKLSIECLNPQYNDSSTAGHTGRGRGNIRADFMLDLYHSFGASDLPAQGSVALVTLQTAINGTIGVGAWGLSYGLITLVAPSVPVEGDQNGNAEGISAIVQGSWTAYNGTINGSIISPTGAHLETFTGT